MQIYIMHLNFPGSQGGRGENGAAGFPGHKGEKGDPGLLGSQGRLQMLVTLKLHFQGPKEEGERMEQQGFQVIRGRKETLDSQGSKAQLA